MKKKKRDDNWDTIWTFAVIFGIPLTILWVKEAENPISPIIAMIGIVGVIACGYLLYKFIKERIADEQQNKNKIKYTSIAVAVCAIMAISGICSVGLRLRLPSFSEKEKVIKNVDFNGIDENSVPLSASDLKLFKKGNTYTVVATLKKNSSEPQEGYFEFDISLLDKNGKRINSEHINTMPTPDNTYSLFTYGSENYFEYEIYIPSENKPAQIVFSNIQECNKEQLIRLTLDKAKEYLNQQDLDNAKKYALEVLKYDPENMEAKALSGQFTMDDYAAMTQTQQETSNVIIGSDKEAVRKLLGDYKETKSIMSDNALDFENNDLLITVYFNSDDVADGVLFMQNSLDGVDTLTGEGAYTSKHYDELVAMATNDPNVKVETDLTKHNSQGVKKYPMEIYVGNIPDTSSNTASASTTDKSESTQAATANTEKSEFSYCLSSGIVKGVKLYSAPNNDSYFGTITSFSDDILDERGKKTKGVYISGGKSDGWYKRSEIGRLYVRNDDPCLPSGRYVAEGVGVN